MKSFRTLLVINRRSGVGLISGTVNKLGHLLSRELPADSWQIREVNDHTGAFGVTQEFLRSSATPAFIIAGGGGGTLRAVIEAICRTYSSLPDSDLVRIATLRMGSGNVLAKLFGVPADPEAALAGILRNHALDRTAGCGVVRCTAHSGSAVSIYFTVTMGGFGQFGRIPGDLARWHRRIPRLRKSLAGLIGLEKLNDFEYGTAMLLRCLTSMMFPWTVERVSIKSGDQQISMRLLAGILLKFPLKAIPADPGLHVCDQAAVFYFIPNSFFAPVGLVFATKRMLKRAVQFKIETGTFLEMENLTGAPLEFFLDEDPQEFRNLLRFEITGTLAFVPGADYV
ncbi:MAG TPA: diacylglycerol kinase family protein [Acidobacteriota bacterium]